MLTAVVVPMFVFALVGALWPTGREVLQAEAGSSMRAVVRVSTGSNQHTLDRRDGYLAVGASLSPFSEAPAVARLDPALRDAIRGATRAARMDGIELRVNSGWRSVDYQRDLLRRAVATYGSTEVARQYVKSPNASSHVTGRAVDIGPADADRWLSEHGSAFGLCQTFANESWHFELATEPGGACPDMASDAATG